MENFNPDLSNITKAEWEDDELTEAKMPCNLTPEKRTSLDGKTWWVPYDEDEQKYSTLTVLGKYKTKKDCQDAIDRYKYKYCNKESLTEEMMFKPMSLEDAKEFYDQIKSGFPKGNTLAKQSLSDIYFFTNGLTTDYGKKPIIDDEKSEESLTEDLQTDIVSKSEAKKAYDNGETVYISYAGREYYGYSNSMGTSFEDLLDSRYGNSKNLSFMVDHRPLTKDYLIGRIKDRKDSNNETITEAKRTKFPRGFKLGSHDHQNVIVRNPYNYTIQELSINNRAKTFERGDFSMGRADIELKNKQEYEDIVDLLKDEGYTEIPSDYHSLRNRTRKGVSQEGLKESDDNKEKLKVMISDIDWDLEVEDVKDFFDEDDFANPSDFIDACEKKIEEIKEELPTEIAVEIDMDGLTENDVEDFHDRLLDAIYDKLENTEYGWTLINGYNWHIIDESLKEDTAKKVDGSLYRVKTGVVDESKNDYIRRYYVEFADESDDNKTHWTTVTASSKAEAKRIVANHGYKATIVSEMDSNDNPIDEPISEGIGGKGALKEDKNKKIRLYVNKEYVATSNNYPTVQAFIDKVREDGFITYQGLKDDGTLGTIKKEIKPEDKLIGRIVNESLKDEGRKSNKVFSVGDRVIYVNNDGWTSGGEKNIGRTGVIKSKGWQGTLEVFSIEADDTRDFMGYKDSSFLAHPNNLDFMDESLKEDTVNLKEGIGGKDGVLIGYYTDPKKEDYEDIEYSQYPNYDEKVTVIGGQRVPIVIYPHADGDPGHSAYFALKLTDGGYKHHMPYVYELKKFIDRGEIELTDGWEWSDKYPHLVKGVKEVFNANEDDYDDFELAGIYGGDMIYCPICGRRLEYSEDGDHFCPKCKKSAWALAQERREKDKRKSEDFSAVVEKCGKKKLTLDESSTTIESVIKDIKKAKAKLIGKKPYENFGQDEVRKLRDKYSDYRYGEYSRVFDLINQFDEWCSTYTG